MALVLRTAVFRSLLAVIIITLSGTLWSVFTGSYLDTSNPLISHLPHPHHASSYFANKRNPFNTILVKRAWGWTLLAMLANIFTLPKRRPARLWQGFLATFAWLFFASWFFGPSLSHRLAVYSGADCVVQLPAAPLGNDVGVQIVSVPAQYCIARTRVNAKDHASLFADALMGSTGAGSVLPDGWSGMPKLTRGHDISGHVFLLTMSVLVLVENLDLGLPSVGLQALDPLQLASAAATTLLAGLWFWMLLMTSIYFHAPTEKVSGLLVGILGYLFTRIPSPVGSGAQAKATNGNGKPTDPVRPKLEGESVDR